MLLGHVFHVRCCLRQQGGPQLRGTQGSAGVSGRLCPSAGGCEPRPGSEIRSILRLREKTGRRERGGRQEGAGPTWIGAFRCVTSGSSSKYAPRGGRVLPPDAETGLLEDRAPRSPGPGVLPLAAGGGQPLVTAGAQVPGAGPTLRGGLTASCTWACPGQLQADSPAPSRKWEDRVLHCSRCQQALCPTWRDPASL